MTSTPESVEYVTQPPFDPAGTAVAKANSKVTSQNLQAELGLLDDFIEHSMLKVMKGIQLSTGTT